MFTVKVYGKKARHINMQDCPQTRIHLGKRAVYVRKGRKEVEEKKGRKKLPVPGRGFEPTTLTLEGKAPVCIATFTLHKDPWLQLLYKYHEGNILNSIAQYPMHMMEREREREKVS